jgi:lipoyl(octanoyl) transferase 2
MIRLCALYGVEAFRTKDTGVWCATSGGDKKIGSIGIHLRRNITSHGIGLNITNEVMEYFDRIDACGLGKGVTTLEALGVQTSRERVEMEWAKLMGEKLKGKTLQTLKDVGELETLWGLKEGEILDVMFRSDMRDHYAPEY